MSYQEVSLSEKEVSEIFDIEENHFNDFKAKEISGKKLSKAVSAFSNASGGDIYVGIREEPKTKIKHWEGFPDVEAANSMLQVLDSINNISGFHEVEFLMHPVLRTYVLKITVFKTQAIVLATDDTAYVRKGAQSLPADTPEKLRRLQLDKGITSYENEPVAESEIEDAIDSDAFSAFSDAVVPSAEPEKWLRKQRLIHDDKLTVAGELLFVDEPQICLPKRSSIKIFRYKTSGQADRGTLAEDPITIEGCAYNQIYDAVEKVKEIIESMKKLGASFETIEYPEETLQFTELSGRCSVFERPLSDAKRPLFF